MNRHGTTEELLAARDGAGSAWVREHVAVCRECSTELFRLDQVRARLRSLPAYAPPRDRWADIARVAQAERRGRRRNSIIGLTAAAALTALAFASLRPANAGYAAEQAALERAMASSRALEQTLQAMQPERQSLPGAAAQVAAELESRLSRLDALLGDPAADEAPGRRLRLWQERAGLMGALVDVHVTRVAAAGL